MRDQSPEERLAKHRAVAAWLEYQLRQEHKEITKPEKEAAEWERRKTVAHRESRYTIEESTTEEAPTRLHRGACGRNPNPGDYLQAPEAALQFRDRNMVACETCKPLLALRGTWIPRYESDDGA